MEVGKMPAQRKTNQSRGLTAAGLIAVTAATLLMMAWAIFPAAAGAQAENTSCADLGLLSLTKFEPITNGIHMQAGVTITVDDPFFDWSSSVGIDAVIVKGGSTANVYTYDEATGDTGLHAPINPNTNQPFGLSHIEFCVDEDQPPEKGRIEIEKKTVPSGDPATFDFTGDLTSTLGDGGTDGKAVDPGIYHVTESAKTGWALTDITCTDLTNNSSGVLATGIATFNVAPGETVHCTFTNTKNATTTTPPGGGGGGGTTTTPPPAPTTTTTTTPIVAPTTVHNTSTTPAAEVLPTTVRPGKLAFTGIEDVVPIGALALTLMTTGSGLLWAGSRRRRHDGSEDED
jgi:hypothetical protein